MSLCGQAVRGFVIPNSRYEGAEEMREEASPVGQMADAPNLGEEATPMEKAERSGFAEGFITLRDGEGREQSGYLTGERDETGRLEYYVEGDLQHLRYASEEELQKILTDYESVEERREEVPAVEQMAEAPELGEESAPIQKAERNGEWITYSGEREPSPTPLERIPRDDNGKPMFEHAENPEHGWDALVEHHNGDAAKAKVTADIMVENKRKALEKAKKLKPKGNDPDEILSSQEANEARLAQAEREYNLWQQIANVEQRRQEERGNDERGIPARQSEEESARNEEAQTFGQMAEAPDLGDVQEKSAGTGESDDSRTVRQDESDQGNSLGSTRDKGIDDFFGPVYTEFQGKGNEAEAHLLETCEGVAKGALTYPGIQPIDLAWGDKKAGYMKIVIKHPEVVGRLQELINQCAITNQSDNRIVLESDTHKFIVSKMKGSTPTDNWLLTAYEKKEKSVSASSSDIETEPEGKRNGTATPQNGLTSERKVNDSASEKQGSGIESSRSALSASSRHSTDNGQKGIRKRRDNILEEARQEVKGFAAAEERLNNLDPESLDEAAAFVLTTNKILWGDRTGTNGGMISKGVKGETGFGNTERKAFFGMFASAEKGGKSLQSLAEDAMQGVCETFGIPYDNQNARDALIDVFMSAKSPTDIYNYIRDKRIDQALELKREEENYQHASADEWAWQNYGMSFEDYEAYEEQLMAEAEKALENFDENEYYGNIADELKERENELGRTQEQDAERKGAGDGTGGEILSAQRSDTSGGGREDAGRPGVSERDGDQGVDTPRQIPANASGREVRGLSERGAGTSDDSRAAAGIELTEEDSEPTASEPVSEYSAENANFVSYWEDSKGIRRFSIASRYETKDGKTVRYTSENPEAYGGLFDFDFSEERDVVSRNNGRREDGAVRGVDLRTGTDDVQRGGDSLLYQRDNRLDEGKGEFSVVERVFTENGSFNFTSGEKIESADDVAFIFSALEDAAKEHSFVVLVKDGQPTVVELGMGTFTATMVDVPTASLAYSRIKPDQVYFVHNHPSGNLKCSPQDVQMLRKFEEMSDVPVMGVIINLKTGKYGTFDTNNNIETGKKRIPANEGVLAVHTLDKQIFAPDYDPMAQPLVHCSRDVATFLNSHRMGDRAKVSFIILTRAGRIVGNIHTPFTEIPADVNEIARYISERVIQFGGESAILYGDFATATDKRVAYRKLKERMMEVGATTLLDVVNVKGNHTTSANDEGLLYEPGSEYGASPEGDIRFREVEDDAVLKEFAEGKTVKAYRTMQVIDGKLYSPMATKVGGKATPEIKLGVPEQAEEHPEIIKRTKVGRDGVEVGYVVIDKGLGKGTLVVAYNPSIHASLTPLNDQFTSADIRPNLVIVETLIPKSELTSGYRAPMAKDAVGEMSWHSGTVSGKLAELGKPRRVILSRYDMPVRIVPFKEVAQMIAAQLEGTDIDIPYNVVTPQVRMELQHLGIAISDTPSGSVGESRDFGKAEYITDQEIERINAHQQEMAQSSPEAKSSHAEKLAKKFNTPIQVVADPKELTSDNADRQARMRRSKGFYDPATGKVVVVLANNANVEDVAETVFHEVVAHKGLREMLGDENYDAFCDEVYDHLKDDLKEEVDRETTRRFEREPEKGYEHARRVAVDELFGRLAEKGFEDFTKEERGIWRKLKQKVLEAINKFLGSLRLPKWVRLGDNELRYMLWQSHERLRRRGSTPNEPSEMDYVEMARDAAKREELGLNKTDVIRIRKDETSLAESNERFNHQLERWESKSMRPEEIVDAGYPTGIMRQFMPDIPIIIRQKVLSKSRKKHGLTAREMRNLPGALANPIFIFKSNEETISLLTTLKSDNRENLFVAIELGKDLKYGGRTMEVNDILTIHGRETENVILPITENGTLVWVNKEKGLEWLHSAKSNSQAIAAQTLEDAAKIVNTFENPTIEEEEKFDYRYRDGETGDIWKDRSVGLQERITNAAIRLSQNQSGDLTLRNEAQKAVVNNLQSLLREMRKRGKSSASASAQSRREVAGAMKAQAMFDRSTVKRVTDLARILMQHGYLSGMTSGEMQRLLSAVKNSTAMHDISDSVQKIMDIMVNNQLRNAEGALRQLLSIRGSKVDARGVEVQGALDVEGQRTMEVVKKAMGLTEDDITDHIAEALNRMGDPDQTIADQAAIEYAGLNMALDYVQNIANSKAEEKALRDSLKTAKEDRDAGRMTDDAYRQLVEATEDAIRKNKAERAEAYFNLVGRLSDSLRESIENAKAFREAEKARVNKIHHFANSDMEGRPTNEHHKDDWKDKFVNNSFVQFVFAPLGTFDQILRVFGNKSASGEGYLWNRFMRGWVDCRNKELLGVKEKFARLDEKAKEIFSSSASASAQSKKGERVKSWGDLIRLERKMPKATVSFRDGGEMRDHELTQGNLLYIYMVDKMTDGRMKLRRMGITEEDITRIENFLDPRFKEYFKVVDSTWLNKLVITSAKFGDYS